MCSKDRTSYVIVGGGVAAVCCAQELSDIDSNAKISVISSGPMLKTVTNTMKIGQLTESFDIAEQPATNAFIGLNVNFVRATVVHWQWKNKTLVLDDGERLCYHKLCIATGGRPKKTFKHPLAISIRDTETVERLQNQIKDTKRVLVVGNGGIATEIVYELKNVEIIWAIRHSSISATFFDEGAAEFFKPMLLSGHRTSLVKKAGDNVNRSSSSSRFKINIDEKQVSDVIGCALGPYWAQNADISGRLKERSVHVIYNVELDGLISADEAVQISSKNSVQSEFNEPSWPLYVRLTDGQVVGCDLLIEATGVRPNSDLWVEQCDQVPSL